MRIITSMLIGTLAVSGLAQIRAAGGTGIAASREGTGAGQEKSVDVTGAWAFQIDLGGCNTGTPTVTFKQAGEKLSGTYSSAVLGEHQFTGTIKGNALTFAFQASFDGTAVSVTYSGTVENESTMKGQVTFGDFGSGTFTAKKK